MGKDLLSIVKSELFEGIVPPKVNANSLLSLAIIVLE
jgi:hypothetical protein